MKKGRRFKAEIKVGNFQLRLGNEKHLIDDDNLSMTVLVDTRRFYKFISQDGAQLEERITGYKNKRTEGEGAGAVWWGQGVEGCRALSWNSRM